MTADATLPSDCSRFAAPTTTSSSTCEAASSVAELDCSSVAGGSGGNVGSGILPPGITFPLPQGPDQGLLGGANYLTPTQGLVNQRNVSIQLVRAAITADGRTFVDLRWYSGVAPCNALDSIKLAKDDVARTVHLTVVEGSGQGDQVCIDIAELHAVAVDLGVLPAGTWTISADGDAPAITLDVP